MDDPITIQGPVQAGQSAPQVSLAPGQSATVGVCLCGECDLSLRVDDTNAVAFLARVTAANGYWLVSNLSPDQSLTIENLDDRNQYLIVAPGRTRVPVPFELSQVGPSAAPAAPKVVVFGAEPRSAPATQAARCPAATLPRPLLDPSATYFRVLRELCRPRLVGAIAAPLPTSSEIASTLSEGTRKISARAVDAHIKYVSKKFELSPGVGRDALITLALRSGVFTG